jgi:hypothetical protein
MLEAQGNAGQLCSKVIFGALSALGIGLVQSHVAPGVQDIVGPGLYGTSDRTVAPGLPRYVDRKVCINPIARFEPGWQVSGTSDEEPGA